jgi:RNA polymerase sigma-70 factor (ECF subfamily)
LAADETCTSLPHGGVPAFTQLLGRCQRKVFLYALGMLHNAADAEEVLQETNILLWEKFDQYQPGTDFARWACCIAHFQALKLRKKKSAEERLFSDQFIEIVAARWDRTFDQIDSRREALDECLGKLSSRDRELVVRRYQAGATTRSVAEALGRSVVATRRRLRHIRDKLMGCIQRSLAAEDHRGSI